MLNFAFIFVSLSLKIRSDFQGFIFIRQQNKRVKIIFLKGLLYGSRNIGPLI